MQIFESNPTLNPNHYFNSKYFDNSTFLDQLFGDMMGVKDKLIDLHILPNSQEFFICL
jgi:hypothetical protein